MKNFAFLIAGLFLFASACTDPEKDPLQFEKITKGSIIALRGTAVDNLNQTSFRGSIAKFSKSGDISTQAVKFDADFLSDDLGSLSEVRVYAKATDTGVRTQLGTMPGSAFSIPAGENYPRASFSYDASAVLSALNLDLAALPTNSYLFIECDLTLTNGTIVPSSAIVNSSLFESALFYPAHNLRILIVD
ncbi:MAG: hypothetical protein ACK4Q5_09330 [Saprospiraceae bacterium]